MGEEKENKTKKPGLLHRSCRAAVPHSSLFMPCCVAAPCRARWCGGCRPPLLAQVRAIAPGWHHAAEQCSGIGSGCPGRESIKSPHRGISEKKRGGCLLGPSPGNSAPLPPTPAPGHAQGPLGEQSIARIQPRRNKHMILRRHAGCRDNSFFASPRGSERVSLCCPAVCRVRLSRCNPIARFACLVAGRRWGGDAVFTSGHEL